MSKKTFVYAALAIFFILLTFLFIPQTSCDACDDSNPCTQELCGRETAFKCKSIPLSGPRGECSGVTEDCKMVFCSNGLCITDTTPECCGNGYCERGESEETCLRDCGSCPKSCDDGDLCTADYCGISTGYGCVHEKIFSPDCGTSCPLTCDDELNCTKDDCSNNTGFACTHTAIIPCCGNHICDSTERLSCVEDCPLRENKLNPLPRFKGTSEADWVYPYEMNLVVQTQTENITFQVSCEKNLPDGATQVFLPFITESISMGRFVKETVEASFNGFIECAEGLCDIDSDYSKEGKRGTRIKTANRGAQARIYFYILFKEKFFYDFGVEGRVPKDLPTIHCNLTVSSDQPLQKISESFDLSFKPSCDDKIRNQGEVYVDCGGPCSPCECLTDSDCGRSGFVSERYCYFAFDETVRDYQLVVCEEPAFEKPFCNVTITKKSLGYPCMDKSEY